MKRYFSFFIVLLAPVGLDAYVRYCVPQNVVKQWKNLVWEKDLPDFQYTRDVIVPPNEQNELEVCGVYLTGAERRTLSSFLANIDDETEITKDMINVLEDQETGAALAGAMVLRVFMQYKNQLGGTVGDVRAKVSLSKTAARIEGRADQEIEESMQLLRNEGEQENGTE